MTRRPTQTGSSRPLRVRLGAAFRKQREQKKLSQDAFADLIEMHRAYYSAIERGEKNLQLDTLERVCDGLGTRISAMFSDAESMS